MGLHPHYFPGLNRPQPCMSRPMNTPRLRYVLSKYVEMYFSFPKKEKEMDITGQTLNTHSLTKVFNTHIPGRGQLSHT